RNVEGGDRHDQGRAREKGRSAMSEWTLIKERVDIVQLIGEYVPLLKVGRTYNGLCPFHPEKIPSFMVDPERRQFRCFGCGVDGDVFSWLERTRGLSPEEALETLAERVRRGEFEQIGPLVSCDWCRELVPHDD